MKTSALLAMASGSVLFTSLALVACGNGTATTGAATTAATGSGGAGGSTGHTGSTTTGMGNTGGCSECTAPPCYVAAFAACPTTGACIQQNNGTASIDVCYASGVKVAADIAAESVTYYKADGSVCVSETSAGSASDVMTTFKDGMGNVLFTGEVSLKGKTISCNGQTFSYDPGSLSCLICNQGSMPTACTQGSCTVP